eukprot:scaffold2763_cov88-Skeletonema_dohrnii-CCMP3373.AAC.10
MALMAGPRFERTLRVCEPHTKCANRHQELALHLKFAKTSLERPNHPKKTNKKPPNKPYLMTTMSDRYPIASFPPVVNIHDSSSILANIHASSGNSKNNGPASPHQLDELAAASIFMIRNNATTAGNKNSQMHKVELKEQEESNNVQPKASSVVNRPPQQVVQTGQVDGSGIPASRSNDSEDAAYVYRDFAQEEDPTERINANYAGHSSLISHEDETTRSLASQKLPAKLAAMLSDPEDGHAGVHVVSPPTCHH